ncbi:114aa long hypothetical protein [Pyrococcus horikoshii OT3]|uniref:Uncharacterized protein n=1 Tax=Pyrococcus horikoshii (strain ATCC 700860 / DSM 12428 / JCM 9974 / NBRC 100139 / OT-3) TaxID=70601 RepID=O58077_PYRHO|nr:114aa long hypothetical protein [Pyrococcus horikoshii OT3]
MNSLIKSPQDFKSYRFSNISRIKIGRKSYGQTSFKHGVNTFKRSLIELISIHRESCRVSIRRIRSYGLKGLPRKDFLYFSCVTDLYYVIPNSIIFQIYFSSLNHIFPYVKPVNL